MHVANIHERRIPRPAAMVGRLTWRPWVRRLRRLAAGRRARPQAFGAAAQCAPVVTA